MATLHELRDQLDGMFLNKACTLEEKLLKAMTLLSLMGTPLCLSYKEYAADGVADMTKTLHLIGSGVDITGVTPAYVGQVAIVVCTDSTNNATATCGSGVTWEGTNDRATFPDAYDTIVAIAVSTTRWHILINLTGVTFD